MIFTKKCTLTHTAALTSITRKKIRIHLIILLKSKRRLMTLQIHEDYRLHELLIETSVLCPSTLEACVTKIGQSFEVVWDVKLNAIAPQETCLSNDDSEAYNNVNSCAVFFYHNRNGGGVA